MVARRCDAPAGSLHRGKIMTKTCTTCAVEKPLSAYRTSPLGRLGVASQCRPCAAIASKKWNAEHPDTVHNAHLKRQYGITVEKYAEMLSAQAGGCAICGGSSSRRLSVDHCHTSKVVRGLLCDACNMTLGKMADDPSRLRAAAAYLELHQNAQ